VKKITRQMAFLSMLMLIIWQVGASGQQGDSKRILPPGPSYKSATQPTDSGQVKPMEKSEIPIRIAVLGLETNPFWIPVKEGALAARDELKEYNATVDWIVPFGDAHTADVFGNAIDAAIAQEYDAIVTIAGDSGIIPYIERAVEAGIPVATFNVETDEISPRLFFVGADLYRQGIASGEAVAEHYKSKGILNPNIAVMTGFFSVEGHELRRQGFEEKLMELLPDAQIIGRTETLDKDDNGYQLASDFIVSNPKMNGFYSAAGGSVGIAKAIEDNNLSGIVDVFCYDFMDQVMEYVKKGVIVGTIGQQPYAQGHDPAIRLFNYLVAGEIPEAGRMLTKSDFVTKENMNQFGNW
jgi:ABC-type sugar transport system substrate-binding protein